MTQHIDILDEQESLRTPLAGSLAAHLGIVALAFAYMAFDGGSHVERWGDPKSLGGGAVGITPVQRIPLPSRQGRINPVANDTNHKCRRLRSNLSLSRRCAKIRTQSRSKAVTPRRKVRR